VVFQVPVRDIETCATCCAGLNGRGLTPDVNDTHVTAQGGWGAPPFTQAALRNWALNLHHTLAEAGDHFIG
jgi:hypothetical protein